MEAKTSLLQGDPKNLAHQIELLHIVEKLQKLEERKLNGQQLRSRIKWLQVGDRCTKEFFEAYRQRTNTGHITELEDAHGQIHKN